MDTYTPDVECDANGSTRKLPKIPLLIENPPGLMSTMTGGLRRKTNVSFVSMTSHFPIGFMTADVVSADPCLAHKGWRFLAERMLHPNKKAFFTIPNIFE